MATTRKLVLMGFIALALALNFLVKQQPQMGAFCPILVNPQNADGFDE